VLGYVETAAMLGLMATGLGMGLFMGNTGLLNHGARWLKFGSTAWRGESACARCGSTLTSLTFKQARSLQIMTVADEIGLQMRCYSCGHVGENGGYSMNAVQSAHVLRRVLAHKHFSGASEARVKDATRLIDQMGSSGALTRRMATNRATLKTLSAKALRTESIALEIAVNDENERRLLELELEDLEARWKEEEELAAIVDRELTPLRVVRRYFGGE
jgi:hypothetical protein